MRKFLIYIQNSIIKFFIPDDIYSNFLTACFTKFRIFLLSMALVPLIVLLMALEVSAAQLPPSTRILDTRIFQSPGQLARPNPGITIQRKLVLSSAVKRIKAGGSIDFQAVIYPSSNTQALYYFSVGGRIEPNAPHRNPYRKYFAHPGQYTVSVKANLGPDSRELYSNSVTVIVEKRVENRPPAIRYSLSLTADPKHPVYVGDSVPFTATVLPHKPVTNPNPRYNFLVNGRNEISDTPNNIYYKRFDRAGSYTVSATAFLGRLISYRNSNAITINVKNRPSAVLYSLSLTADPKRPVYVGDSVPFTATVLPHKPVTYPNPEYSFLVNGRNEIRDTPNNIYYKRFDRAGSYTVSATAFLGRHISYRNSNAITINVKNRPSAVRYSLRLTANRTDVQAGDNIELIASVLPQIHAPLKYTFRINGREELTASQSNTYLKRFDRPGTYSVSVTSWIHGQIFKSNRLQIYVSNVNANVLPEPIKHSTFDTWFWLIPIIIISAGVAAFKFKRQPVMVAETIEVILVPDDNPVVDIERTASNGTRIELILVGDAGEQDWETQTSNEETTHG